MTPAALRTARRGLGLTQEALAATLGVSVRAVQSWEQGQRPVPGWVPRFLECISKLIPTPPPTP